MKPGKVNLGSPNNYSLLSVTQGTDRLFGTLRMSSDKQYSVIFCDGYMENRNNVRNWVAGKICLIEKDTLLWIKDVERPTNAAVSNTGITALLHTTYKESSKNSKPQEFVDLGGTLTVIGRSGEEILSNTFGSNLLACAISRTGAHIAVATLAPDDSIYCFDAAEKKLIWKYKNHARKRVLGLAFNESQIDVFVGGSLATKEKEYSMLIDGNLTPEYQKKFEESIKIKKQPPSQKVESLIAKLNTNDSHDVMDALEELKSFVYTKGSVSHYGIILDALRAHFEAKKEVFDAAWKVLRVILKKKPAIVDPYVPEILKQLRVRSADSVEGTLMMLGELGNANPAWVRDEQPFIMEKLKSKAWNERRFAAFAIGSIGASDPTFARDAIPIMIEYAAHPERVSKELENLAKMDTSMAISLGVAGSMGVDPAVWLRDACIDALGMIGKTSPESVVSAITLLESLAKEAASPYTQRKATRAIELIRGKK